MDFKIATALNLSPELVWFSRQSYEEEVSSSSSADGPGLFSQDWPCRYGGHFPEMPHDLGSDGTQSPGRDDTDETESIEDFSQDIFLHELMILGDDDDFDFGEDTDVPIPPSPVHHQHHQPSTSPSMSPVSPSLFPFTSPDHHPPAEMDISYSPSSSPGSPSPFPGLMVASSPVQMETLLAPVAVSRLQDVSSRRPAVVQLSFSNCRTDSPDLHRRTP